ncbi:hypothetical protein CGI04_06810 [Vibrio parahaemolyticus]|nr:hypothetical protein CGI04_06810 [Vibrio parahaemolyticus]
MHFNVKTLAQQMVRSVACLKIRQIGVNYLAATELTPSLHRAELLREKQREVVVICDNPARAEVITFVHFILLGGVR